MKLVSVWVWACVWTLAMAAPKPGAPGHPSSPPLPSPPSPRHGLFAVIKKLQDRVQELEQLQNRDRAKFRRLERRGRECREGLARVQADMVQLRQTTQETNTRLAQVDDHGSDVSLEVLNLKHRHDALKTLVQRMRSNHSNEQATNGSAANVDVAGLDDVRERLGLLEEDKTRMGAKVQRLGNTVHRLHSWQDTADVFLEQLRQGVNLLSRHLALHVLDPFRHLAPPFHPPGMHPPGMHPPHQGTQPHTTGAHPHVQAVHRPTEGTLLQPVDTTSSPDKGSSQTTDSSARTQGQASNASHAQSTASPPVNFTTQADADATTVQPPKDDKTPEESPLYHLGESHEMSEELEADYEAALAAEREGEGMEVLDYTGLGLDLTATSGADYSAMDYGTTDYGALDYGAGSSTPDYGDYDGTIPGGLPGLAGIPGSIPVNIPQRPAVPSMATTPGSLDVEDGGSGEADLPVGPPPVIVCPTWRALKADNSSLYLNVSLLEERVEALERELRRKLDADLHSQAEAKVREMVMAKCDSLADEVKGQKKVIREFDDTITQMDRKVQAVEERVAALHAGGVMRQLQTSFLNFSQHVVTLEQWQAASAALLNATTTNQQHLARLTAMLVNATQRMTQLEWQATDQQLLTEQQYNVLRTHIIRLNNSLQDLQEHVQNMQRVHNRPGNPPVSIGGVVGGAGGLGGGAGPGGEVYVSSKLEDLTLQLVYNENRIAGLESRIYNKTLSECKKVNDDMYRDSRLSRLEDTINALSRKSSALQDSVGRAEGALYRSLTFTRNHTSAIADLTLRMSQIELYAPQIQLLRQEVTNLLEQVPVDCQTYRDRGHVDTGIYVIYPKGALQSVRVQCVMAGKEGWTVLQHRYDGSESFARGWAEYAVGFGQAEREHWLGNEFLHLITWRRNYTLRVEMTDIFGGKWMAEYGHFRVGPKGDNYRLEISGYHGNATDGLNYTDGMAFSTPDRDNDYSSAQCAAYHLAGWWYRHCQYSNLNGRFDTGIIWFHTAWQDWIHLRHTRMMIRPSQSSSSSSSSNDFAEAVVEGKKG